MATTGALQRRFRRSLPKQADVPQPVVPPRFHEIAATIGFTGPFRDSKIQQTAIQLHSALRAVYQGTHDSVAAGGAGWYVPAPDPHITNRVTLAQHGLIEQREELVRGRYHKFARITPAGAAALNLPYPLHLAERLLPVSNQTAIEIPAVSSDLSPLPAGGEALRGSAKPTEGSEAAPAWGVGSPTFAEEFAPQIIGNQAHIYIPCANCASIFVDRWPAWFVDLYGPERLYKQAFSIPNRLCPFCAADAPAPDRPRTAPVAKSIPTGAGIRVPDSATSAEAFFGLLEQAMAEAIHHLEQDQHVILRGHRPNIDAIRRYVVCRQEQIGILEYRAQQQTLLIDQQRQVIQWWQREAEHYRQAAEINIDVTVPDRVVFAPQPPADPDVIQRLSKADVEFLNDLCRKHLDRTLAGALDELRLPELDEFQVTYNTLGEAINIIAKRIVDQAMPVMAYAARSKGKRGGGHYLAVHFGFGEVHAFDKEIKSLFMRYPHDLDYDREDFDIDLDPPVELVLMRDNRGYPRIDNLTVIE